MPRASLWKNRLRFMCPGCRAVHEVRVAGGPTQTDTVQPSWSWNGSLDAPTLEPSVEGDEIRGPAGELVSPRCHSFVRDGRIEFLADSGHALAGQTVDLPEVAA